MVKKEEKTKTKELEANDVEESADIEKKIKGDVVEQVEVKKQLTKESIEEFIRKNAVLILIALVVFSLFCTFLIRRNSIRQNGENGGAPYIPITKYEVKIHIDFMANLIFSRYDVRLSANGEDKLLDHGKDTDFVFSLEEGKNTLTFKNDEDSSVKTTVELDVTSDMEVGYKISCFSDKIDVEELYVDRDEPLGENKIKVDMDKKCFNSMKYEEAKSKLEELGFTNITLKPLYDIILGITPEGSIEDVTIDGQDDYRRGDVFDKSDHIT